MIGKKILIIDDEPAIHRLLKVILEVEGFQIVGPEEHQKARKSIASGKPDVIILDIMMPEVDGFEILKMLKGDQETRHIPVIVLTVRSLKEDIEKAASLGADCYMTKPFEPSKIVEAVHAVLSGQGAGQHAG
jgi:DNA-binding response OmpR family regulator